MPLHVHMGWDPYVTHLQHLAWIEWLRLDMNRPGKAEVYSMATAAEVRMSRGVHVESLDDMRVVFPDTPTTDDVDDVDDLEALKARHLAVMGGPGRVRVTPPREGDNTDDE